MFPECESGLHASGDIDPHDFPHLVYYSVDSGYTGTYEHGGIYKLLHSKALLVEIRSACCHFLMSRLVR